jgi:hypothetical protein
MSAKLYKRWHGDAQPLELGTAYVELASCIHVSYTWPNASNCCKVNVREKPSLDEAFDVRRLVGIAWLSASFQTMQTSVQ